MKTPPPPDLLPRDDTRAGARLTEALSSALGCVAAAIARNNGYDLTDFQAFVANHFAYVFEAESACRPVYH